MSNSTKRPQTTPERRAMSYALRVLELIEKLDNFTKVEVLTTAGHMVQLAIAREQRERAAPPRSLPDIILPLEDEP